MTVFPACYRETNRQLQGWEAGLQRPLEMYAPQNGCGCGFLPSGPRPQASALGVFPPPSVQPAHDFSAFGSGNGKGGNVGAQTKRKGGRHYSGTANGVLPRRVQLCVYRGAGVRRKATSWPLWQRVSAGNCGVAGVVFPGMMRQCFRR